MGLSSGRIPDGSIPNSSPSRATSEAALMKKIARNLREAPDEKRLPNRRLQRSVLVVYVSGSDCAAWAAVSSILSLVLLLSLAYISGGGGGVNPVPSRAFFLPSTLSTIKCFFRRFRFHA